MNTPRDNIKTALEVASNIPVVGQPANIILNVASNTGYFDKGAIERLTDKEMFYDIAHDAIPVHPELYQDMACTCTPTGKDDDLLCWKKGFVGALDKGQIEVYCPPDKRNIEATGLTTRLKDFTKASEGCEIGKTYDNTTVTDIIDRLKCMHDKLSTYNIAGVD